MKPRRRQRKAAGLPLPSEHGPVKWMPVELVQWAAEPCPGCGRVVLFLPDQETNTCGWCQAEVTRGVG